MSFRTRMTKKIISIAKSHNKNHCLNPAPKHITVMIKITYIRELLTLQQSRYLNLNIIQSFLPNPQTNMFVVEALYPFSAAILKSQQQAQEQQKTQNNQEKESKQEQNQITYITFEKGDKILVHQSYDNGWWYGHTLKQPDTKGFFPSNYIQTSAKPKPPPPPPQSQSQPQQQDQENPQQPQQKGVDWVQNELKKITQGPVRSDYYLGIKGYKNVKIDEKNQNVLKGDHVRFDVSTGLAKVPVKDQAPVAKAVRQMGYYFDYHQWNEERNKQPHQKARPDPKKKKIKKLNLKGMK